MQNHQLDNTASQPDNDSSISGESNEATSQDAATTTILCIAASLTEKFMAKPGESNDVANMVQRIKGAAEELFPPAQCMITALNPETGKFLLPFDSMHALGSAANSDRSRPQPDGMTQHVLERGTLLVPDLAEHPEYHNGVTQLHGIEAFAALALHARPQRTPLAVLYLNYTTAHLFSEQEQVLLNLFVEHASAALQHAWLFYRYAEVTRIGQEINQQLDTVPAIFTRLMEFLGDILDISYAVLLALYQPERETLDFHVLEHETYHALLGEPFAGGSRWVIHEQKPLLVRQLSAEAENLPVQFRQLPNSDSIEESLLFVPLLVGKSCLGVLSVQHPTPNYFDEEDLQILSLIGNHVALALHHHRLFENLLHLNEAGQQLTRLLNSKQVLESVVEQIQRTTHADIAVLYPYVAHEDALDTPRLSGALRVHDYIHLDEPRRDDIALLTVARQTPIYATDSRTLYTDLGGDPHQRAGNFAEREQVRSTAAVPLRVSTEPVGALFINFRIAQSFDATQRQVIEGLATYAAIAIANAREFDTLVQRTTEAQRALNDVAREVTHDIIRQIDRKRVLDLILERALQVTRSQVGTLHLYDTERKRLVLAAEKGVLAAMRRREIALGEGIVGLAAQERQTINVADVEDSDWAGIHIPDIPGSRSELAVPLIDDDELRGVLNLEHSTPGHFGEQDKRLLTALADLAIVAIKNLERQRLDLLRRVDQQIIEQLKNPDPEALTKTIIESALRLCEADTAHLDLHAHTAPTAVYVARRVGHGAGVAIEQIAGGDPSVPRGIVQLVADSRQAYRTDDAKNDPYYTGAADVQSELAVPLLDGDTLVGVLNVESRQPDAFSLDHEQLLRLLATHAAIALQNAQQFRQMEHLREDALLAQQRVREAEAMTSMGQTAVGLVHRLGNDIGPIPTSVNAIRRELEQQGWMSRVLDTHLERILADKNRATELSKAVKEQLADIREQIERPQLPVTILVSDLLEETVRAYPHWPANIAVKVVPAHDVAPVQGVYSQISDILINLFVNAVQALPNGGTITLRAYNGERDVRIEVTDTGVGIAKERQKRVFDLFYSTKEHGFGFGLWSARRYALANNGELTMASEVGKGTTFTLSLLRATQPLGGEA
jgi:GAF domain-containing protein/anti-sigma regulatory factor (Ser/Thr protein kinase)